MEDLLLQVWASRRWQPYTAHQGSAEAGELRAGIDFLEPRFRNGDR